MVNLGGAVKISSAISPTVAVVEDRTDVNVSFENAQLGLSKLQRIINSVTLRGDIRSNYLGEISEILDSSADLTQILESLGDTEKTILN